MSHRRDPPTTTSSSSHTHSHTQGRLPFLLDLNHRFLQLIFIPLLFGAAPFLLDLLTRCPFPLPQPGGGVVVTGASTGIGAHAALTLAERGFVVFAGVRKISDGENLKRQAAAASGGSPAAAAAIESNLVPLLIDVTKKEQIEVSVETVKAELAARGNVNLVGLVNNAGVGGAREPIEFLDVDAMKRLFDVNLWGAITTTQAFLPLLRQSRGRIINISSMAGLVSGPLLTAYCGSKWALEAFSDALRAEMHKHDVSVSVVEPAYVQSAIFGKMEVVNDQHEENAPVALKDLYGHLYTTREHQQMLIDKADPPTVTSEAIFHALTSEYPQTRYVVANVNGVPAKVLAFIFAWSNDRLRDNLIFRSFMKNKKQ